MCRLIAVWGLGMIFQFKHARTQCSEFFILRLNCLSHLHQQSIPSRYLDCCPSESGFEGCDLVRNIGLDHAWFPSSADTRFSKSCSLAIDRAVMAE